MNVSLTPELERLINERVKSGMYGSSSEVIRESLRLLKERDEEQQLKFRQLQRDITIAASQADRGQLLTEAAVMRRLSGRRKQLARTRKK